MYKQLNIGNRYGVWSNVCSVKTENIGHHDKEFYRNEIKSGRAGTNNNRAAGMDGIQAEQFKANTEITMEVIYSLMKKS